MFACIIQPMLQHSWCCSSSVSSWGDSSGQFSLQSFLPASGMPVSQALFQARSFLDISLIPCTETAPAAADAPLSHPARPSSSIGLRLHTKILSHPSLLHAVGQMPVRSFPYPKAKSPACTWCRPGFHGSIKVCGGADGWPVHPSSGSAARPPTRSVTESPPACRHRLLQAAPEPKGLPHGHWPEDRHRPGRHRAARRRRRDPAALQVCGTSAGWCYLPCGPTSSIQHHWANRWDRSA